jgi:hypothetical protein
MPLAIEAQRIDLVGTAPTAVLLGAGFSKWAADLPVVRTLFDWSIEVYGPIEAGRLSRVVGLKERWDRNNTGAYPEHFISHALTLDERDAEAVLWYIGRRLGDSFIWGMSDFYRRHRFSMSVKEGYSTDHAGINKAAQFLRPFWNWDLRGVLTTNYDLLIEYAVGANGFNYGTHLERLGGRRPWSRLPGWTVLQGTVPLAKLHGSLSWDRKGGRFSDARGALTGKSLVVAPVPGKAPPSSLEDQWRLAASILVRSERLLVFGFAFNPYDEAVLELLSAGGEQIRDVLVIDVDPKLSQAQRLWPLARVQGCTPPPSGTDMIRRWRNGETLVSHLGRRAS